MAPGRDGKAAIIAGAARRVPWPVWALGVCALFALAGIAVVDDYGVSWDELMQRRLAAANLDYIQGDKDALPTHPAEKYYGMALELPLLLAERGLGLDDSRNYLLSRHLLTHLFFLAGGFFAALLAYRVFGSKWLALLTLLLFLLHPRLYAHSFFNSKDVPALSMLMIALYLTHRAFRRDTIGAFALAGVGVALAMNLRIMGAMLFPAVVALRGCDLWHPAVAGDGDVRRVLLTGGAFLLAGVGTLYATMPCFWEDPLALLDAFAALSQHTNSSFQLFQGETVRPSELPARYLPTWIAITTPPGVLLLGLWGAAAVCGRSLVRPGDALRNTRLRFGLLLAGCFALPMLGVAALGAHMYDGWRQMYLLYAPLCLLASFGLYYAAAMWGRLKPAGLRGAVGGAVRRTAQAGVFGLAAAGLVGVAIAMAQLHPQQQVYFNFLVDRKTPEYLRTQYDMEYWGTVNRQALEYLLERHPDANIYARSFEGGAKRNRAILPEGDRRRIILNDAARADYYISFGQEHVGNGTLRESIIRPVAHWGEAYNNTIYTVEAMNPFPSDSAAAAWQEIYQDTVSGAPAAGGVFDLYLAGDKLTYLKEPCVLADTAAKFFLHISPADAADLPGWRRQYGFDNLDFLFDWHGVMFDSKCLATVSLPGYAVAGIRTGQFIHGQGEIWSVELPAGR